MAEGNTRSDDYEIFYRMLMWLAGVTSGTFDAYKKYLRELEEINGTLKMYKGTDSVIAPDYEPFMKRTVADFNQFISEYKELKKS